MGILLRHKFLVVLFIVLIAGIGIGIYLLQNPQIFRSKASLSGANWINAFEITDASGKPIICETSLEIPTCPTTTLTVNFKLKDLSLLTDSNVLGDSTDSFAPPPPPPVSNQGTTGTSESSITPSQTDVDSTTPTSTSTPTPVDSSPIPVASPEQGSGSVVLSTPSASVVSSPIATPSSTQGVSIQINDQNLPIQVGSSLAVILSSQPEAASVSAMYDVRVLVTMPGNSLKPFLAKFNYTPSGLASRGSVATNSAQPVSTGSAKVVPTPKTATASANTKYDLNKDGTVNSVDSSLFLTKWRGKTYAGIDINGDGKVNIFDYSDLKKNFN